jgi:hypothetical protein
MPIEPTYSGLQGVSCQRNRNLCRSVRRTRGAVRVPSTPSVMICRTSAVSAPDRRDPSSPSPQASLPVVLAASQTPTRWLEVRQRLSEPSRGAAATALPDALVRQILVNQ